MIEISKYNDVFLGLLSIAAPICFFIMESFWYFLAKCMVSRKDYSSDFYLRRDVRRIMIITSPFKKFSLLNSLSNHDKKILLLRHILYILIPVAYVLMFVFFLDLVIFLVSKLIF